jgi:pyruvate/2-oxoglutarate dehydrogenase complex dihydrolipoamide acyltransferase (E2) component
MTSSADLAPEHGLAGYEDVPRHEVRLKPRRRALSRNLEASSRIPTLTADMQMDMSCLLASRAQWNQAEGRGAGDRISVSAFVARAALSALQEFPVLNATYTERALIMWDTVNLAVAVDAPGGLVVPVLRDAQTLGVQQISSLIGEVAERARSGGLAVEDMAAGTFTLSNPGSVGPSLRAEALLNPPQVALLGLPGLKRIPTVVSTEDGETVAIRSVLCPSLSFDHRALDGGDAIRFLSALTRRVENWSLEDYLRPAAAD